MRGLAVIVLSMLAACGLGPETPGEAAERKISADLNAIFPGIDVEPAANCVRDQASEREISVLGAPGVNTQALTRAIFERPDTLTCLQANGVIEVIEDSL